MGFYRESLPRFHNYEKAAEEQRIWETRKKIEQALWKERADVTSELARESVREPIRKPVRMISSGGTGGEHSMARRAREDMRVTEDRRLDEDQRRDEEHRMRQAEAAQRKGVEEQIGVYRGEDKPGTLMGLKEQLVKEKSEYQQRYKASAAELKDVTKKEKLKKAVLKRVDLFIGRKLISKEGIEYKVTTPEELVNAMEEKLGKLDPIETESIYSLDWSEMDGVNELRQERPTKAPAGFREKDLDIYGQSKGYERMPEPKEPKKDVPAFEEKEIIKLMNKAVEANLGILKGTTLKEVRRDFSDKLTQVGSKKQEQLIFEEMKDNKALWEKYKKNKEWYREKFGIDTDALDRAIQNRHKRWK